MSDFWIQLPAGKMDISDILAKAPTVAEDLCRLALLYGEKASKQGLNPKSITQRARKVINVVRLALEDDVDGLLKANGLNAFMQDGFNLLKLLRKRVSAVIFQEFIRGIKLFTGKDIDESHYGNKTYIHMSHGYIDVTNIRNFSEKLYWDVGQLVALYEKKVTDNGRIPKSITARASKVVNVIQKFIEMKDNEALKKNGLQAFMEEDFRLLKSVKKNFSLHAFDELVHGLKLFTGIEIDESHYGDKAYLYLKSGRVDITEIKDISESLYQHLLQVGEHPFYQGELGHAKESVHRRYGDVVSALKYCINSNISETELLKDGFVGFTAHNYKLLKVLSKSDLRRQVSNELLIACSCLFDQKIHQHALNDNLLAFYFSKRNKWKTIDFSMVKQRSPIAFNQLVELQKLDIELLPQRNYDMETLVARFSKINTVLKIIQIIDQNGFELHGFKVMGMNRNKVQKQVFEYIQSQVKADVLSVRTGDSYFGVIRWFMPLMGMKVVDSFRISYRKHQAHAKRLRMEKTYSDEELKELVFYLEKAILNAKTSQQLVSLYFAKIQIKTCWNTSPMTGIELSDINAIELPTGKVMMSLMLQKPRKGYDVDTFKLDGRAANSVMKDLEYVKAITQNIRSKRDAFKDFLFIFEEYSETKLVDLNSISSYVSTVLSREGCSIRYDSQRLRKSGANHLYKEVEKNLRKYKDGLRHSYATFVKHYQQIEETKSLATLHSAVKTMEDYFKGREISIEIQVLEKDDSNAQRTPTGLCNVAPFSAESAQYHKEHYQLHKEAKIESKWCSDYLACIWCQSALGSRIASVHNGSSLFTGDAGGGSSNIRRLLIESDLVEAIIQLPNNFFYNTGISTYIWLLNNKKVTKRQGKIQLIDSSLLYRKLRKNLGDKNCEFAPEHIQQIVQTYLNCASVERQKDANNNPIGLASKVFKNADFGYYKVTIERPDRRKAQFRDEAIAPLRFDKALSEVMEYLFAEYGEQCYQAGFLKSQEKVILQWCEDNDISLNAKAKTKLLAEKTWQTQLNILQTARTLMQAIGEDEYRDFNEFKALVDAELKAQKIKLSATEKKAILNAVSWYDQTAEKVIAKTVKLNSDKLNALLDHLGCIEADLPDYGYYPVGKKGEFITYESNTDLRDSESIPLNQTIHDYFLAEVQPHVNEAWINLDSVKIGYEISFNKYFYEHKPLRALEDVAKDIVELEQQAEGLIADILGISVEKVQG